MAIGGGDALGTLYGTDWTGNDERRGDSLGPNAGSNRTISTARACDVPAAATTFHPGDHDDRSQRLNERHKFTIVTSHYAVLAGEIESCSGVGKNSGLSTFGGSRRELEIPWRNKDLRSKDGYSEIMNNIEIGGGFQR